MEENKKKKLVLFLLPELCCMALTAAGIAALYYAGITEQAPDRVLSHIVLIVLGLGIVGFVMRTNLIRGEFDYDNGRHIFRVWFFFVVSLVVAFLCAFLPAAAWPFLPIFIFLALFSNLSTGVLAGAVLLAIPCSLTGAGIEVYLLYVVSGCFGAVLLQRLRNGSKTGIAQLLSLGCLFVCLTAGTVLTVNARPGWEYFVVPIANIIVSGILIFGVLKYFFSKSIYFYRDNYLELNDPENAVLAELKQRDRNAYLKSVHTVYFCERIAAKLELNADALKCAGYYHSMGDELPELPGKLFFPPEVIRILEDYRGKEKGVHYKETAVLMASDDVISAVLSRIAEQKDKPIDYDREIDAIFQRYHKSGVFDQCDIAVKELQMMRDIFKGEKLYYDFLR